MLNAFYCKICEIGFNDSGSYMDHLNGRKHNRVLGMNMKVKKSSVSDIEKVLQINALRKKTQKEKKFLGGLKKVKTSENIKKKNEIQKVKEDKQNNEKLNNKINLVDIISGRQKETDVILEDKEVKKDKDIKENDDDYDDSDEMDEEEIKKLKAFGFPLSFGSSKKYK